ncbi:MAG: hypothetical protein A3F43_06380 [Gammaproteobacteria bacterium RIFCSPHIGHO2_12_FULL_42_10]|nr:MAG: hypothetical protein A3F43_06380 [Gammaproteobacteria bacterium RIFCSPHIGHO2_12_FULL_42_10]
MSVEVAYADSDQQSLFLLEVEEGTTISQTIARSGVLNIFPEIDPTQLVVGIFSRRRVLSDIVKSGDRVEIYRALRQDPMVARRVRAKSDRLRSNDPGGINKLIG